MLIILFTLPWSSLAFAFPLDLVKARLNHLQQAHQKPVAVFDLDETLVHSMKRMAMSYQKAIELNRSTLIQKWPVATRITEDQFREKGEKLLRSLSNQYDSQALFQRMGIQDRSFIEAIEGFRLPIYLSNEFIPFDTAYRGAVQLLNLVYQAKGRVNFVSSRYESTQFSGTLRNLVDLHLYRNSKQSIIRLRNDGERSIDFKVRIFSEIKAGLAEDETVFMVGENEPENFNALTEAFPKALAVFVEGAKLNSKVTIHPVPGMVITRNFVSE